MAINRRLLFWLVKAYLKRWGKIILLSFVVGLGCFFLLRQVFVTFLSKLTTENKQTIGVVGAYSVNSLPDSILSQLSRGLTKVGEDGVPHPDIAQSWNITDSGKTYSFTLKKGITFSDGTPVTSKTITIGFSDVTIARPDDYTLVFHLKESYSPFLITLSRPLFTKNFIGTGPFVVNAVKLNGSFVETLSTINSTTSTIKIYQFYPTEDALKIAYSLGEISTATGLSDIQFENSSFANFSNTTVTKSTQYNILVTLFYNTTDKNLSDKRIRDALSYALPNSFTQGERAYSPISPKSWAYQVTQPHTEDLTHASSLLDSAGGAKSFPVFTISTLPAYEPLAKELQKAWERVGIKTKISVGDSVPQNYEMFLADYHVPKDPDQYTLWHSYQTNNITNFNSDKRIDKLLEDGRQTVDINERIKIYDDFQKYLLDEQPATFLYFPYDYTIRRK